MPSFDSGGVTLDYEIVGQGKPILLLHGGCATRDDNWNRTGWYGALNKAKRQVIALDQRGHGHSQKLYDPADYTTDKMMGDAIALLDHLKIERSELMGFSMGAMLSMNLITTYHDRFSNVVLAGVGDAMLKPREVNVDMIGKALLTDDPETIKDPLARGFRLYAEKLNQDMKALAACTRAERKTPTIEELGKVKSDVLVIAGSEDDLAGNPEELARHIPGSKGVTIPGADHMFILPNPVFKGTIIDFFTGWL